MSPKVGVVVMVLSGESKRNDIPKKRPFASMSLVEGGPVVSH